jgi:hypothetical protein
VLTNVDGEVEVQTKGVWQAVDVGFKVDESSVVKTGRGGSCDLQFGRLATLHLSENTLVALKTIGLGEVKKAVDLEVISGTLTAKVSKLLADQRFHVRTDTVVAGVRGTRFLVSKRGTTTSVAVAEGLVALVPPANGPEAVQKALDSSPSVGPGHEADLSRAGETPVVGPVGEANRRTLEATASMTILNSLPVENSTSGAGSGSAFGPAVLVDPAPGVVLDAKKSPVSLTWRSVAGASSYEVTLSRVGETGTNPLAWTTPDLSVGLGLAGPLGPGTYEWAVTAVRTNLNLTEDRSRPARARFTVTR